MPAPKAVSSGLTKPACAPPEIAPPAARVPSPQGELPLFAATAPDPIAAKVREAVAALDPDQLTPRAALDALYHLRALLKDDKG